jgi:hypothetical protein
MRFRRRAASARKFTATLTCSFCGKHQRQVKSLIGQDPRHVGTIEPL